MTINLCPVCKSEATIYDEDGTTNRRVICKNNNCRVSTIPTENDDKAIAILERTQINNHRLTPCTSTPS